MISGKVQCSKAFVSLGVDPVSELLLLLLEVLALQPLIPLVQSIVKQANQAVFLISVEVNLYLVLVSSEGEDSKLFSILHVQQVYLVFVLFQEVAQGEEVVVLNAVEDGLCMFIISLKYCTRQSLNVLQEMPTLSVIRRMVNDVLFFSSNDLSMKSYSEFCIKLDILRSCCIIFSMRFSICTSSIMELFLSSFSYILSSFN